MSSKCSTKVGHGTYQYDRQLDRQWYKDAVEVRGSVYFILPMPLREPSSTKWRKHQRQQSWWRNYFTPMRACRTSWQQKQIRDLLNDLLKRLSAVHMHHFNRMHFANAHCSVGCANICFKHLQGRILSVAWFLCCTVKKYIMQKIGMCIMNTT